jgi:choline dehydrogenase-like flavoprotein
LHPYYPKARASLGFIEDELVASDAAALSDGLLHLGKTRLSNEICPLSPTPDLGTASLGRLRAAGNIWVLLHANATEISTNPAATRATGVRVATLERQTFFVEAEHIVVAAGGLENARLLLLSNRTQVEGLGNGSDFVGRCFMEHPRYAWGELDGRALQSRLWRYDPGVVVRRRKLRDARQRATFGAGLVLNTETQRKEEILGARSWIVPIADAGESEGAKELKELVFWLKKKRLPSNLSQRLTRIAADVGNAGQTVASHLFGLGSSGKYQFITVLEQSPNVESRVTLDPTRDSLGLNRVRLEWRVTELEELTLERNRAAIIEDLQALGLHCLDRADPKPNHQRPKWVWHHIGTTRMSADPKQGVVDANCRVHSVDNLYIAGSSVFPTGGNDMPTLTVIALAHRLADHLKGRIQRAGNSLRISRAAAQAETRQRAMVDVIA